MDIEKALLDPASVYGSPDEVKNDSSLTLEQKRKILRRWEYDARELEVAEEENFIGGPPSRLREISRALSELETDIQVSHAPPTKHGGA